MAVFGDTVREVCVPGEGVATSERVPRLWRLRWARRPRARPPLRLVVHAPVQHGHERGDTLAQPPAQRHTALSSASFGAAHIRTRLRKRRSPRRRETEARSVVGRRSGVSGSSRNPPEPRAIMYLMVHPFNTISFVKHIRSPWFIHTLMCSTGPALSPSDGSCHGSASAPDARSTATGHTLHPPTLLRNPVLYRRPRQSLIRVLCQQSLDRPQHP